MAIVTEYNWKDDTWTHTGDPGARAAWRAAVAEIAERAKQTLPECNGRVGKAMAIVLNGDVELLADGKAKVASQSNGTTEYFVVNGECQCKDFPKAPSGWCKHRIAAGMQKRAVALMQRTLAQSPSQAEAPTPPPPAPLPEAPASVNVRVRIGGREVQWTLRDTDEARLAARLDALLQRYPVEPPPATSPMEQATRQPSAAPLNAEAQHRPTSQEGWCPIHHVAMTRQSNARGSWWSHPDGDGWCRGKRKKGA